MANARISLYHYLMEDKDATITKCHFCELHEEFCICFGYTNLKLYRRLRYSSDRDYRGRPRIYYYGEGLAISISMSAPLMYLRQTCYHFNKTYGFRRTFARKIYRDFELKH